MNNSQKSQDASVIEIEKPLKAKVVNRSGNVLMIPKHRGFPIPFFVAWVDGKPDFRLLDRHRQQICAEQHKCAICGTRIRDVYYFIGGPLTCKNQYSTDPAMHRECAEFSLQACPHMYYQNAERNERGSHYQAASKTNPLVVTEKPTEIYLIKASKYKFVTKLNQPLIKFKRISWEVYEYSNGVLNQKPTLANA